MKKYGLRRLTLAASVVALPLSSAPALPAPAAAAEVVFSERFVNEFVTFDPCNGEEVAITENLHVVVRTTRDGRSRSTATGTARASACRAALAVRPAALLCVTRSVSAAAANKRKARLRGVSR